MRCCVVVPPRDCRPESVVASARGPVYRAWRFRVPGKNKPIQDSIRFIERPSKVWWQLMAAFGPKSLLV